LAQEQETATNKESVLKALDKETADLRGKLGETLASIRRFDTPVDEATTPSLEALKAFSLGLKTDNEKGTAEAIPLFKSAIELRSQFRGSIFEPGSILCEFGTGQPSRRERKEIL
jgi:eukaryotic-like serine/threonine-protein kinase